MNLTDKILDHENLMRALHQIKNNKGKAGIDGMSVEELDLYFFLDMKKRSVLKSEKEDTVLFLLRGFILKSQTATKRDRLESLRLLIGLSSRQSLSSCLKFMSRCLASIVMALDLVEVAIRQFMRSWVILMQDMNGSLIWILRSSLIQSIRTSLYPLLEKR